MPQVIMEALPWIDKEHFNMEPRSVLWDTYFTTWAHGMKVFLLNEHPIYVQRSKL